MKDLTRITADPQVMGGKPCIRGLRVTVGTIVGLVAAGRSKEEILKLYPYLEEADLIGCALRQHGAMLEQGALISIDEARLRSRVLPLAPS